MAGYVPSSELGGGMKGAVCATSTWGGGGLGGGGRLASLALVARESRAFCMRAVASSRAPTAVGGRDDMETGPATKDSAPSFTAPGWRDTLCAPPERRAGRAEARPAVGRFCAPLAPPPSAFAAAFKPAPPRSTATASAAVSASASAVSSPSSSSPSPCPARSASARSRAAQSSSSPTAEPTTDAPALAPLDAPPLEPQSSWAIPAAPISLSGLCRAPRRGRVAAVAARSASAASIASASTGAGSVSSGSGTCSTLSPRAARKPVGGSRQTAWYGGRLKTYVRSGVKSVSDQSATVWSEGDADKKMRPSAAHEREDTRAACGSAEPRHSAGASCQLASMRSRCAAGSARSENSCGVGSSGSLHSCTAPWSNPSRIVWVQRSAAHVTPRSSAWKAPSGMNR